MIQLIWGGSFSLAGMLPKRLETESADRRLDRLTNEDLPG